MKTNCSTIPVITLIAGIVAAWKSTEIHAIRVVSPIAIPPVLSLVHRGGDLCVDNEGNFFSPRASAHEPQQQQQQPQRPQPKRRRRAGPEEQLRGGAEAGHRLGGLCVDAEGNLYSDSSTAASSAAAQQPAVLRLRGGNSCGLLVDKEGNFYTPLAAVSSSPAPYAPVWMEESDKSNSSSRRRRRAPSSGSHHSKTKLANKSGNNNNNKKNHEGLSFIHDHNLLMET